MSETTNENRNGHANILMLGYNGANNTGAEALLLADIADMRAVLGQEAMINIPSINPDNLRRYVAEGPKQRIPFLPTIFFRKLHRLVRENDLIFLVEGSTYMDTWTSALLWAYLWTTRCAHRMNKPCAAYAVDAGEMRSPLNRRLVRSEASKTDLIITRAKAAAERMRQWGVTAPMETTADNAFTFQTDPQDQGLLRREWPEAGRSVVGLALVDFNRWPVHMRLWGRREDCYKWPYYFSRSPERQRASEALAQGYAELADRLVEKHGRSVALICMEQLDEGIAEQVYQRMKHKEAARIFSSRRYNASQMTVLLRSLDLLVTSRYHACVLSLAGQVPQVAVGHDLRLRSIYTEMGLHNEFFIDSGSPTLHADLEARVERLLADPTLQRDALRRSYDEHLAAARRNRELLRSFVQSYGWGTHS